MSLRQNWGKIFAMAILISLSICLSVSNWAYAASPPDIPITIQGRTAFEMPVNITATSGRDLQSNTGKLVLDLGGISFTANISSEGRLLGDLFGAMPDDTFSLKLSAGTQVLVSQRSAATGASLSTPNSIPQKIAVTIPDIVPDLPKGWVAVSQPFDINGITEGKISGVKLNMAALMVFKYDDSRLPERIEDLGTFYYDYALGWSAVKPSAGFVAEGPEVAVESDHFSLFMVMAKVNDGGSAPADINIQTLNIEPSEIIVGQSSEVRIKAVNKGGSPGDYSVVLKMNNQVQKSQIIHLDTGQSTEIAMLVAPQSDGIYNLTAGLLEGELIVENEAKPQVSGQNYWWLLCLVLGMAIVGISLVFWRTLARSDSQEDK
jgi:hypothetical protein